LVFLSWLKSEPEIEKPLHLEYAVTLHRLRQHRGWGEFLGQVSLVRSFPLAVPDDSIQGNNLAVCGCVLTLPHSHAGEIQESHANPILGQPGKGFGIGWNWSN